MQTIKIYTCDTYWQHILTDLGHIITPNSNESDINFDDLQIHTPVSILELQKIILDKSNHTDIIKEILHTDVNLPQLQHNIIVSLYKNDSLSIQELKKALGINENITTHIVENAIYKLRKEYGHNIIINKNGKYKLGRI